MNASVIVVVNGNKRSSEVIRYLEDKDRVVIYYSPIGSAPLAQYLGRKKAKSEYFGFLDDDDILLPNALLTRATMLEKNNEIGCVVDQGVRNVDGIITPIEMDIIQCNMDPLDALLQKNWMASCSALFSTKLISEELFENPVEYVEWTFLAFKLCKQTKIKFINSVGFQINSTANSLSASDDYRLGEIITLKRMVKMESSNRVQELLNCKLGNAYHGLSLYFIEQKNIKKGLYYNFKTTKYFSFIRVLKNTVFLIVYFFKLQKSKPLL